MFTGLIEGMGWVEAVTRQGPDAVLTVKAGFSLAESQIGDSIAVSGPCLTVTGLRGDTFDADVSAETLDKTNLGRLSPGQAVNLERALRLGDRLGGHLVSGHIDGLGRLVEKIDVGSSIRFRFELTPEMIRYVIPKGSIAIDGISLTVNQVSGNWFEVNIIPHTAKATTIGLKKPGEMINIETDLIGKYVERLVGPYTGKDKGLTKDLLARSGFLD